MKKSMQKALVGSALVLCAPLWAQESQVDYSKCQEFLTPSLEQQRGLGSQPAGYLPFDIGEDGSIQPHQDVVSYEQDKDNGSEVITYEVPDYAAGVIPGGGGFYGGASSDPERTNPYKMKMRKVQVRIERDDEGQLSKIVTDNNFSTRELSQIQKRNTENFLASMNEQQQENFKKMNGDKDFSLPLYQRAGAEISFKIQNGQCVAVEHDERYLVEAKPDGESTQRTVYNTELCHEIDDFLNEHPETAACFNPEINKKMSDIFKSYYEPPKPISSENHPGFFGGMMGGFAGGGLSGFGGFGMGSYGIPDLDSELMMHSMRGQGHEDIQAQMDRRMGRSPVISSHMILQRCYDYGLGSFIDDPTLWEKAGVTADSAQSEDESSTSAR